MKVIENVRKKGKVEKAKGGNEDVDANKLAKWNRIIAKKRMSREGKAEELDSNEHSLVPAALVLDCCSHPRHVRNPAIHRIPCSSDDGDTELTQGLAHQVSSAVYARRAGRRRDRVKRGCGPVAEPLHMIS
jgi:hypothetical protein